MSGVCKAWVSNTQCAPEEHLSTRETPSSPGTERSNHSPCRETALLWEGKERNKRVREAKKKSKYLIEQHLQAYLGALVVLNKICII